MNELASHIASLLRENDCVIVPGFGGFIAHYAPAQQENEDFVFLPPMRVMGFNPQLRINDGLLAQSYMSVYGFSFPEAVKIIQQQSEERGPGPMSKAVVGMLDSLGVDPESIMYDNFGG